MTDTNQSILEKSMLYVLDICNIFHSNIIYDFHNSFQNCIFITELSMLTFFKLLILLQLPPKFYLLVLEFMKIK